MQWYFIYIYCPLEIAVIKFAFPPRCLGTIPNGDAISAGFVALNWKLKDDRDEIPHANSTLRPKCKLGNNS